MDDATYALARSTRAGSWRSDTRHSLEVLLCEERVPTAVKECLGGPGRLSSLSVSIFVSGMQVFEGQSGPDGEPPEVFEAPRPGWPQASDGHVQGLAELAVAER
jgi:hypothetical protein